MKLSIITPVFNEAKTVRELLDSVLAVELDNVEKEIIIVESNSTDGTREIVKSYENHPGVRLVLEDKPSGKGSALRNGLKQATGDFVLIQDGDLEYKTSDYPRLLEPLVQGEAQAVYGSRVLGKGHWQFRRFHGFEWFKSLLINVGGALYSSLFNLLYETHLTDPATMYKIVPRELLNSFHLKCSWFDLDWEITAKLAKAGVKIQEVPISYKARSPKEGKKIRFFRDGILVLWTILKYRFVN